ncbi:MULTISPECIES: TasA family protein [Bacillus]|jgi:predicted ribosomally synthesized peptide with SipW-like signal peptide|uniref:Cell division protein FtsN n=1 Tax=Bacillus cereus TaxID=1396 RepID=A0A9X6B4Y5_BACCE|nr:MULTISPECIES: TasA family protein [Bacillus]AOM03853.1 Cell envelope-bound metalloprotease, Camelysin [Bacillus cereus]ASL63394.1 Cell envelope-bound metalloprotease (Camelysin) [Bacillus cereus]KMP50844.1 cell division protein FtsN [Bacillus cereus]KMP90426.1 cell division protein FtsN [Bacillus cereus]MBJ8126077.1 cell division protein FtsN [Bacillus cereus]
MSIKKKLGMGVVTAALGLSLISGGTYAYFSDKEVSQNTFAAGTLDLSVNPEVVINVDNIKPGDEMERGFQLVNKGTLAIGDVKLLTDYSVIDAKGDNGNADFGDHIRVDFLWNLDKNEVPIWSTTLSELKVSTQNGSIPDLVQKGVVDREGNGLAPGDDDTFYVMFTFVDNNAEQNVFQGDSLKLNWTFNSMQTKGEEK